MEEREVIMAIKPIRIEPAYEKYMQLLKVIIFL